MQRDEKAIISKKWPNYLGAHQIAGYAEEALNSEYALKDAKLTVITPRNELKTVNSETLHKSATVFD